MAEQYEAQVSEADKNQNEQSSADKFETLDDEAETGEPVVIDLDDGVKDVTLEELIRRAGKLIPAKKKKEPVAAAHAEPVVAEKEAGTDEIAALKAQVEQERNDKIRVLADMQNLRRRSDEEHVRIIREGNERLIKEILPVLDDFERGLAAAKDNQSYEQLVDGVESVLRKMGDILIKQGVEPIPSVGQAFDPLVHEAVSVQEATEGTPDESVVQELRKGYTLHGRVIRPSLVTVAKS
jgi:molecular chaperone GrpE